MYRYIPHNHSDADIGLLVVMLAVGGGLMCLYNAWRMGRLPWKPKGPANPKLVCLVTMLLIILIALLN